MPFESRSQLGTCYAGQMPGVDCDEWLRETRSVCGLPYRRGIVGNNRRVQRRKGPVRVGPRGGRYFTITERDARTGKKLCTVKVYLRRR